MAFPKRNNLLDESNKNPELNRIRNLVKNIEGGNLGFEEKLKQLLQELKDFRFRLGALKFYAENAKPINQELALGLSEAYGIMTDQLRVHSDSIEPIKLYNYDYVPALGNEKSYESL